MSQLNYTFLNEQFKSQSLASARAVKSALGERQGSNGYTVGLILQLF